MVKNMLSFSQCQYESEYFSQKQFADHRVEEYKENFQDYWKSSKPDLTNLQELKSCLELPEIH